MSNPSLFILSLSYYRAPYVNNGGENETAVDEPVPWRDAWVAGERQRETETKETEHPADGTAPPAETLVHRKGSANQHRFNTLGYQRRTRQKVVTDLATVSKAASAGVKPRGALRQVLFSQGVSEKNPTPENRGQLDLLKQSLQAFPVPVDLRWRWEEKLLGTTLEKSWTELVHSHSTMSKTQRHQQEALWEFVHTELTYINKLTVIKDLVIAALVNLHQHGFLLEVTPELLFSNLPSILSAHRLFWQEVMYPMLREVRKTGRPFDPLRLEAGCLQFHKRFSSYLPYCWEEEDTLEFTRREMDTNPHFFTYVQWVETHPQCERMRVGDMQAKPHQRITKYPLLLKAVLKTTQDPHVQHKIRHMLSSVNGFLESINDYMRLKDEELALSISAQRVEGYVVEGINEEIDKHVRELCQFDLTGPMKGVGPGTVRKLLLEENLKVRARKDSKLDVVVALLFSDVLLITKVQKKAERLKVVRPPLALDRSHCSALKDGSSFVVVELSELGCAMNVYIFSTATPESSLTWVSTIHQAQETLKGLRETENNRQMDSQKLQQSETITKTNMAHKDQIKNPLKKSGNETFVDNLIEEPVFAQSVNGMLTSRVTDTTYRHSEPKVTSNGPGLSGQQHKFSDTQRKSAHGTFSRRAIKKRQETDGREWIELGVIGDQQWEQDEFVVEFRGIKERATWNHNNRQSASELSNGVLPTDAAKPFRSKPSGPHSLLIGGVYPDVDYPLPQAGTSLPPYREHQTLSSTRKSEFRGFPAGARGRSLRRHSESRPAYQGPRRDSWHGHSAGEAPLSDSWSFSSNLRSPKLRRRRPISSHHGALPQMYGQQQQLRGSGASVWSAHTNSSSNSDSDCNQKHKGQRSVSSSGQNTDSHLVLKLGSLKQLNLWDAVGDRVSPDLQNRSEPEQPNEVREQNSQTRRPKLKAQRSSSIPDLVTHGGQGPRQESRKSSLPRMDAPPYSALGLDPRARSSTLVGFLERAKERGQTNGKLHANLKAWNLPPSPSYSTTPSQSPISEGDRDTEWEEVEVMRCRAPTVSKGWREQLVDGDEDERKSSSVFADGVNVDWSGWCFDDEEVMDHLNPGDYPIGGGEGLMEGISRTLTAWDMKRFTEQEEGEVSQV